MPKQLARILSWYSTRCCWRKTYRGRSYYLGTKGNCNGPDDLKGYEAALGEWLDIKRRLDSGLPAKPVHAMPLPPAAPKGQAVVNAFGETIHVPNLQFTMRMATDYKLDPDLPLEVLSPPTEATLKTAIDTFTAEVRQKVQMGKRAIGTYRESVDALSDFRGFCERHAARLGIEKLADVSAHVLICYRRRQLELTEGGKLSPYTAKRRLAYVRRLLQWAYENEYLDALPRNCSRNYSQVDLPDPEPRPLSKVELNALWKAATTKTKFSRKDNRAALYIALGLNCGYRGGDIANLKHSHIRRELEGEGDDNQEVWYIVRKREKTGSPQCHKLWAVTKQLLEMEMTDPAEKELMLLDERGQPLICESLDSTTQKSDPIGRMFARLRKKLGWTGKGRGQGCLRDTGAQALKDGHYSRAIVKSYLGHKERDVVRHYVTESFESYGPLFAALDWMEKHFDLKLPVR